MWKRSRVQLALRNSWKRNSLCVCLNCAVSVAILFHADKHCLSAGLLGRSIRASTDRAAIMSSLAGRTAPFLCFAQQVVPSERTQVCESMTKPQSAQVKANIYLDESAAVCFCLETLSHAVKVSEALYVCLHSVLRFHRFLH